MMPDQSQGACQSIEDAAALGIVFGKENFQGDIREALEVYEQVRKPRATKVQAASARARENINERIGMCTVLPRHSLTLRACSLIRKNTGFSSNTVNSHYSVEDEENKLTIDEMNLYEKAPYQKGFMSLTSTFRYDMHDHIRQVFQARRLGTAPNGRWQLAGADGNDGTVGLAKV